MSPSRRPGAIALVLLLLLLALPACNSKAAPTPTLETLEEILSVTFPYDVKVIGGSESQGSGTLWLIASTEPLPLPDENSSTSTQRSRQGARPKGTEFPVSALSNLIAACEVSADEVPKLTERRGVTHTGQVRDCEFDYREARTDRGWLTAVEIHLD